ncbi:MAG TPA: PAS domain S-box protein, partial [Thermomicrobiales bacterium]|nr:PAS domain S-box protein [Thermomicrobiales bacterium]
MEALAEHVGVAIGRARLYQEARLSEERFRTAFASSAIGTALVALDGRWLAVNRALCKIVGYSEAELQQRSFQEITHPDDLAEDLRLVERLLADEIPTIRFEKRYLHKDGHPVWVLLTASLVRDDDGRPRSFLSQVQDIGERRQAAIDLAAERDLLDRLLEHLPEAVYVKDAASRFLRLNPTAARNLGVASPAEAIGRTDFDFFPERIARTFFAEEQRVVATGEPLVNRLEGHDEGVLAGSWWLTSRVPLRDGVGRVVGLVGSAREVTERLRAEDSLKASEERLRLALEAADMASWDWDAATGIAVRSTAFPALFGPPPEAANAPRRRYRELVPPDDRPALQAADRRRMEGLGPYEVEYR